MEQTIKNFKSNFVVEVLKGVSQIFLQENMYTGILFLAGVFYGSYIMGIGAILATAVGTLTAHLLKYDKAEIAMGLYGFSAALVGVCLTFFFQPTPVIWASVIIGGALATIIQHFFIARKIPVFTFPFILVCWGAFEIFHHFFIIGDSIFLKQAPQILMDDFTTSTNGFGEVIFQGSIISGILMFIAVFINDPIAAIYGFFGSAVAAMIAFQFAEPSVQVHIGLFSFNAVLCAITFAGKRKMDGVWVLISVVLSTLIDVYMLKANLVTFTFPFVAASWITLLLKKPVEKMIPAQHPILQ